MNRIENSFELDPLAIELNDTIIANSNYFYPFLSELAKRFFFPKGILEQSAQAAKHASLYNATIGIYVDKKGPVYLNEVNSFFNGLDAKDIYPYAPAFGRDGLRKAWLEHILDSNPSLKNKSISTPIVTAGITNAISLACDFFIDQNELVILPGLNWENYGLMINTQKQIETVSYETFNKEGLYNIEGLMAAIKSALDRKNKIGIILNFPQNPSGYSLTKKEQDQLVLEISKLNLINKKLIIFCDDAYFGLFYEDSIAKESIFARFCDLHENICAVKLDGATKELLEWGFRIGFITIAAKGGNDKVYKALETKLAGLVRSHFSSGSMPLQSITEKILLAKKYKQDGLAKIENLKNRYQILKNCIKNAKYDDEFSFYPFNSGYFACIKFKKPKSLIVREKLLHEYKIGTVAFSKHDLRIAFSSVEADGLTDLVANIYDCSKSVSL